MAKIYNIFKNKAFLWRGAILCLIAIVVLLLIFWISKPASNARPVIDLSKFPITSSSIACADFPKSLEASSSKPIIFEIPDGDFIRTHVDEVSMADVNDLLAYARANPGCKKVSVLFSTIGASGTAYVAVMKWIGSDPANATRTEIGRIPVVITNQYDPRKIPEARGVNAGALLVLDPYLKRFWTPIVISKGDFNADGKDDYLLALQLPSVGPDNNDQIGSGKKNRKLLVLGSNDDGNYSVLLDSDNILTSGSEGGASHPDGPDLGIGNTDIEGDRIVITQAWGTSWRGIDQFVFRYDRTSDTLNRVKDVHQYVWLNGDYIRTRDYTETDYDSQGNKISTRSFQSLDGISPVKDYKAVQLQNFAAFPEFFASTTYSDGVYYLVPYYHTHDAIDAKDLGIDPNASEGAFILHNGKVVWQTSMWLEYIDSDRSRFEDVDGDGIPEIVIFEANLADEKLCNYYLYSWNGGSPKPLSINDVAKWADAQKEIKDGTCKITLGK